MNKSKTLLAVIAAIISVNLVAYFVFYRFDLTEEKRYSISDASQNLLKGLEDEVVIKVYLDGENLPGGFERLKRAVKETLDEFKIYADNKIDFQFIDPNAITDPQKREEYYKTLFQKGMQPTNIIDNKDGRRSENIIFPYATVSFDNKELTVLLLKGNQTNDAQEKLNQSYENVEYELATAIRKLTIKNKKKIGLLTEFTKLKPINFAGLINSLQEYYEIYIIDAKASPTFEGLDALVLPKPDFPVDDSTKYKIDQFIVNGGNALFFVDGLKVDSIGLEGTFAQPLEHNLDDLFFKYGVRINHNIIKDGASCGVIPMVVGNMGDKPNVQPVPYRYFPLINHFGNSLITKNIDMVYTKFTASIDTVKAKGISKTPLLMTSPYTKVLKAPALITYNEARKETEEEDYKGGVQQIAYLLEGKFQSLYQNRIFSQDARYQTFKPENKAAKVIICSDGDVIVNEIDNKSGNPLPLGFDKLTQHVFGNKDFLMNAIDYLVDENGVITARGKEIKIRPLDKLKTRDERNKWQFINLIIPALSVLLFGAIRFWWRKKKYE